MSSSFWNSNHNVCSRNKPKKPWHYPIGISGVQTKWRIPEKSNLKRLLYIAASNARRFVSPYTVKPSTDFCFNFTALSMPGGCVRHATIELSHASILEDVAAVVVGLGTNDILGMHGSTDRGIAKIMEDTETLIRLIRLQYPTAKIYHIGVLPIVGRGRRASYCVAEVNRRLRLTAGDMDFTFIETAVPERLLGNDGVHLVEEGSKFLLSQVEKELTPNCEAQVFDIFGKRIVVAL